MSTCLDCQECPRKIYDQPLVPVVIMCDLTDGPTPTPTVDTEPVCLTDDSGTQFFGVFQFDDTGTFIGIQFYTVDALGNLVPYAPTSAPTPCNVDDIEEVSDCYIAINAGAGYAIGDQITVTRWYDTTTGPPTLTSTVFYNKTTLTPILAVPAVDLTGCFENEIENQQVLCDVDPLTGEILGRAWFELHYDSNGDLINTIIAGVHYLTPGVVERPYVAVGTLGDCAVLSFDFEYDLVCADGQPAFRYINLDSNGNQIEEFISIDGVVIVPVTWTPGSCNNEHVAVPACIVNSLTGVTQNATIIYGFNTNTGLVDSTITQIVDESGNVLVLGINDVISIGNCSTETHEYEVCFEEIINPGVLIRGIVYTRYNETTQTETPTLYIDGDGNSYLPVDVLRVECPGVVAYDQCWEAQDTVLFCPPVINGFTPTPDNCNLVAAAGLGSFTWPTPVNNVSFHYEATDDGLVFSGLNSPTLAGAVINLALLFGITETTSATAETGIFDAVVNGITITMTVQGRGVYNTAGALTVNSNTTIQFSFSVTLINLQMSFANMVAGDDQLNNFYTYSDDQTYKFHQVVFTDDTEQWFDRFGNQISEPFIILTECSEKIVAYHKCWQADQLNAFCPVGTADFTQDTPGSNCALTSNNITGTLGYASISNIQFSTSSEIPASLGSIASPTLGGGIVSLATVFGITATTPAFAESGTYTAIVSGVTVTMHILDGGVYNVAGVLFFVPNTSFWFEFSVPIVPATINFANLVNATPLHVFDFVTHVSDDVVYYNQVVYIDGTEQWFDEYGNLIDEPPTPLKACQPDPSNLVAYDRCWETVNIPVLNCPTTSVNFSQSFPGSNCSLIGIGGGGSFTFAGPINNIQFYHTSPDNDDAVVSIISPTLGGATPNLGTLFGVTALTIGTAQLGTFTAVIAGVTVTLTVASGGVYNVANQLFMISGTLLFWEFSTPVTNLVFATNDILNSVYSDFYSYVDGDGLTYNQVVYTDGTDQWHDVDGDIVTDPHFVFRPCKVESDIVAYDQCWQTINQPVLSCPDTTVNFTQNVPGSNCLITGNAPGGNFVFNGPLSNIQFYHTSTDNDDVVTAIVSPTLGGAIPNLGLVFGITALNIATAQLGVFTALLGGVTVTLHVVSGGVYNVGNQLFMVSGTLLWWEFSVPVTTLTFGLNDITGSVYSDFYTYVDGTISTYHQVVLLDGTNQWHDSDGDIVTEPHFVFEFCTAQPDIIAYNQCWESKPFSALCPDTTGGFTQVTPGSNCNIVANGNNGGFSFNGPLDNIQFAHHGLDTNTDLVSIASPTFPGGFGLLATVFGITALNPATAQQGVFTATLGSVTVTMTVQGGGVFDSGGGVLTFLDETIFFFEFSVPVVNLSFTINDMLVTTPSRFDSFFTYSDGDNVTFHQVVYTNGDVLWFDADGDIIDQPFLILDECSTNTIAFEQCWESDNYIEVCPDSVQQYLFNPDICNLITPVNGGIIQFNGPISNIGFHTFNGSPAGVLSQLGAIETGGLTPLLATIFGVTALTPATAERGTFTGTIGGVDITMVVADSGGVYNTGGNLQFLDHTTFHFTFSVPVTNLEFVLTTIANARVDTFISYVPGNDIIFHQVVDVNGNVTWFDQNGNIIDEPHIILTPCGAGCDLTPLETTLCYNQDETFCRVVLEYTTAAPNGTISQIILSPNPLPSLVFNFGTPLPVSQFTSVLFRDVIQGLIDGSGLDIHIVSAYVFPGPYGFQVELILYGDDLPNCFLLNIVGLGFNITGGLSNSFVQSVRHTVRAIQYFDCEGNLDSTTLIEDNVDVTDAIDPDDLFVCVDCEKITEFDYCVGQRVFYPYANPWIQITPTELHSAFFIGQIGYTIIVRTTSPDITLTALGNIFNVNFTSSTLNEHPIELSIDPPYNGDLWLGMNGLNILPTEYLTDFNAGVPNQIDPPLYIGANNGIFNSNIFPGFFFARWNDLELANDFTFKIAGTQPDFVQLSFIFSDLYNIETWKRVVLCDNTTKIIDSNGFENLVLPTEFEVLDCDSCDVTEKIEICNFTTFNQETLCYYEPIQLNRFISSDGQTLVLTDSETCVSNAFGIGGPSIGDIGGVEVNRNQDEVYLVSRETPHSIRTLDFSGNILNTIAITGLNSTNEQIQSLELDQLTDTLWILTKELAIPAGHLYTINPVTGVATFQGTITGGNFVQEDAISLSIDNIGRMYVTWFQATGVLPVTDTQLSEINATTFAYIGEAFDFGINAGTATTSTNAGTFANIVGTNFREYDSDGNVLRTCNFPLLLNVPGIATTTDFLRPQFGSITRVYEVFNNVIIDYRDYDIEGNIVHLSDDAVVSACSDFERYSEILCDTSGQFLRSYTYLHNELVEFYDTDFYGQEHIIVGVVGSCNPAPTECFPEGECVSNNIVNYSTLFNTALNVNQTGPTVWELIFTPNAGDFVLMLQFLTNVFNQNTNNSFFFTFGGFPFINATSVTALTNNGIDITLTVDFGIIPTNQQCAGLHPDYVTDYATWQAFLSVPANFPFDLIPVTFFQLYQITGSTVPTKALPVSIVCSEVPDRELTTYCYRAIANSVNYAIGDTIRVNILIETQNITNPVVLNAQNVSIGLNPFWQVYNGIETGIAPNFSDLVPCEEYGTSFTTQDVEQLILCDDNGSFIRHTVYESGLVINVFDTTLDSVTPYVTVGVVVNCIGEDVVIQPIIEGALLTIAGASSQLYAFANPVQSVSIGNIDGGVLQIDFITNPVSAGNNIQYVMPGGSMQAGFGENIEIISINITNIGATTANIIVNGLTPGNN